MYVALSMLVAGRQNPRRVKPERDAHRRLVASIRAHGLLEPLLVRPAEGDEGKYQVIAGNRRLAALREVHKGDDPKVQCNPKKVNETEAAEISLAENFAREPMHPLDEAEAFARLASEECKGVPAIAEAFGVSETYVRQRMKLAGLAEVVKAAFRAGEITVGIAEVFAAVPAERQEELWKETGGTPRHAQHVRNLIEHQWIPAEHALFDVTGLDATVVSHDLFGGGTLIHRTAFMEAQTAALTAERARLLDDGWREVVVGERENVQDRLRMMVEATRRYDKATESKLARLGERRATLEAMTAKDDDAEARITSRLEELDRKERAAIEGKPATFDEAAKAAGTVLLMLAPDGRVERRHLMPRPGVNGLGRSARRNGTAVGQEEHPLPTSDELSPRQLAEVHAHEAIAVREAVSKNKLIRKRLLVLALHPKVSTDAVTVRRDANATELHASHGESFQSSLYDAQKKRLGAIDPFQGIEHHIEEAEAYAILVGLTEGQLDAMITMLIVAALTGHGQRPTPLIRVLGKELGVTLRDTWTPDAAWPSGYQKAQLAHLTGTLKGPTHGTAALDRKKSELVEELAAVFSQAASVPNGFDDRAVAERANSWLPLSIREEAEELRAD